MINFPSSPTVGQEHTEGGKTWAWDGARWAPKAAATDPAEAIHAAAVKAIPADADEFGIVDSAASWSLKKLTWADFKTVLLAYFRGWFRERLAAPRTYYVRTDGSDSNDGLSNTSGGAFLTIQKAIDTAVALDLGLHDVTIQIADGTYSGANRLKPYVTGGGVITIRGNTTTPANVLVNVSGSDAFRGPGCGNWTLDGMKLQATTGRAVFALGKTSQVDMRNINFGPCTYEHILADNGAVVRLLGAISISGAATAFANAATGSFVTAASIGITLVSTPAVGVFAACSMTGVVVMQAITFSGSSTGQRYNVSGNGVIQTYGGGPNYLPGSVTGSATTGGQYL